jgi:hypothetical protein
MFHEFLTGAFFDDHHLKYLLNNLVTALVSLKLSSGRQHGGTTRSNSLESGSSVAKVGLLLGLMAYTSYLLLLYSSVTWDIASPCGSEEVSTLTRCSVTHRVNGLYYWL